MGIAVKRRCEICENTEHLIICDVDGIEDVPIYFCRAHILDHLRKAHHWNGESAARYVAKKIDRAAEEEDQCR